MKFRNYTNGICMLAINKQIQMDLLYTIKYFNCEDPLNILNNVIRNKSWCDVDTFCF